MRKLSTTSIICIYLLITAFCFYKSSFAYEIQDPQANELVEKLKAIRSPLVSSDSTASFLKSTSPGPTCGTPIVNKLLSLLPRLSDKDKEAVLANFLRPTHDGGAESDTNYHPDWGETSYTTTHFRVWYDDSDSSHIHYVSLSYAQSIANFMESAYNWYVNEGFSPAEANFGILMDDGGSGGSFDNPDEKYDIYIMNISALGLTYNSIGASGIEGPSYMILSTKMGNFGILEEIQANTCIHELFHALQGVFLKGKDSLPDYIAEGTASWVSDVSATLSNGSTNINLDSVNYYARFLDTYFAAPHTTFLEEDTIYAYGNAIYFKMLSEFYSPSDYAGIIESIWEEYDNPSQTDGISAINTVLSNNYGTTFTESFEKFLVWKYYTGNRNPPAGTNYGEGINKRYFEEDDMDNSGDTSYYEIKVRATHNTYPVATTTPTTELPDALAANYLTFEPDSNYGKKLTLTFNGDTSATWSVQVLKIKQDNSADIDKFVLDSNNQGQLIVNNFGKTDTYKYVIMIPAVVSTTTKSGGFSYSYSATNVAEGVAYFDLIISSPQKNATPFTGTCTLTARDADGNIVTDFDASTNNVTITVSPDNGNITGLGSGNNNVLNQASDFVNGVADLSALGITFTGLSGTYKFIATSSNGKTGEANNIEITPGDLDHFDLSISSPQRNSEPFIGGNIITAKDVSGNTITDFNAANDNVTITVSPANGNIIGLGSGSNNVLNQSSDFVNGSADLTLLEAKFVGETGIYTFTATSQSGKNGSQSNIEIKGGALHHFTITINSPQTNGTPFTGTCTITAKDVSDNTITDFDASTNNVTLTPNPDDGTITGLGSLNNNILNQSSDFANGVADLAATGMTFTGNTGAHTFIATSNDGKSGTSNTVEINSGTLGYFVFSLSSPQKNGIPFTGTCTLTAKDPDGNTINFDASTNNVTITVSPDDGTITGLGTGNNNVLNQSSDFVNGVADLSALGMTYNGKAGDHTFTAKAAGGESGTSSPVTINGGALDHFSLSIDTPQTTGRVFQGSCTLTAQDKDDNTVIDFDASADNVVLTVSPDDGSITGLGNANNNVLNQSSDFVNGIADLANLGMIFTGNTGNHTFIATSVSGKTGTSNTVYINSSALDHFEITISSPQTNATNFTGICTITAVDANGVTITDFDASTDNVTITVSPDDGTISGLGSANNNILNQSTDFINGIADLTSLGIVFTGKAGDHTLIATSQSSKTGTSNTFEIKAGALSEFEINISSPQTNNYSFYGTATITAKDISGNTITDFDASSDNVTITVLPDDGTISGLGSANNNVLNQSTDFVNGIADLVNLKMVFSGTLGPHTFTATSQSGKTGTSGSVEITDKPVIISPVNHEDTTGGGIVANNGWDDDSELLFDWTGGTGGFPFTSYTVYIYQDNIQIYSQSGLTKTWFTYGPIPEGHTYECRVVGINASGEVSDPTPSDQAEDVVIDMTPPNQPQTFTVEMDFDSGNDNVPPFNGNYDDDGKVTFIWSNQTRASGDNLAFSHYLISISLDGGSTFSENYTTTETKFIYPKSGTLSTGTKLKARLWAFDKCGLSNEAVNESPLITIDRTAPDPPINVQHYDTTAVSGYDDDNVIEFTWQAQGDVGDGIAYYLVMSKEATNSSKTWSDYSSPVKRTTTSYSFIARNRKSAYKIAVKAVDFAGNVSATAESNTVVYADSAPSPPSSITHHDADSQDGYDNDQILEFTIEPGPDLSVTKIEIYVSRSNVNNGEYPATPSVTLGPYTPEDIMNGVGKTYTLDTGSTENIKYKIKIVYEDGLGNRSSISACPDSELVTVLVGANDLLTYKPPQPEHFDESVLDIKYDDDSKIEFKWDTSSIPSSVTGYIIRYMTREPEASGGTWSVIYTDEVTYTGQNPATWEYTKFTDPATYDDYAIRISIQAHDANYNKSLISLSSEVIVYDATPPAPAPKFSQPADNVVDADQIGLYCAQISSDTHLKEYQVIGGAYNQWTTFANFNLLVGDYIKFNLLENRENKLYFRAIDYAGNVSVASYVIIIEDSMPPEAGRKPFCTNPSAVDKYGNIWVNTQTIHFSWSLPNEKLSRQEVWMEENATGNFKLMTGVLASDETHYAFTVDDDKIYRIKVVVVDTTGRESTSEASAYVYTDHREPIDKITPCLVPIIKKPAYTKTHEVYFYLSLENATKFTDETSNPEHPEHEVIFQIKGGKTTEWTDFSGKDPLFKFELIPNTKNTLMIRARDLANNYTQYASVEIEEESGPPATPTEPAPDFDIYPGYDIDGKLTFRWDPEPCINTYDFRDFDVYLSVNDKTYFYVGSTAKSYFHIPEQYIVDGKYYKVRLKARDVRGNSSSFSPPSKKIIVDLTRPEIDFAKSKPQDGSIEQSVNSIIEIYFTEAMRRETILQEDSIKVLEGDKKITGTFKYDETKNHLTFKPYRPFKHNKLIKIVFNTDTRTGIIVNKSKGIVRDFAGNPLAGQNFLSFKTQSVHGLKIERLLNYPNPITTFNTQFAYILNEDVDRAELIIYSADGHRIYTADDLPCFEGENLYYWETYDYHGKTLANGTYFYIVKVYKDSKTAQATQKFLILR